MVDGAKINGIIQDYVVASGGNVNAGDFVKYLNEITIEQDTKLDSGSNFISAVKLSENKVFIAHGSEPYLWRNGMHNKWNNYNS